MKLLHTVILFSSFSLISLGLANSAHAACPADQINQARANPNQLQAIAVAGIADCGEDNVAFLVEALVQEFPDRVADIVYSMSKQSPDLAAEILVIAVGVFDSDQEREIAFNDIRAELANDAELNQVIDTNAFAAINGISSQNNNQVSIGSIIINNIDQPASQ
jgi:hypothetical protein